MPAFKLIKSGHIVEIYQYERVSAIERVNEETKKGGRKKGEEGREDRKMEYRNQVNYKARNTLRRLIQANFDEGSLFVTVTFAENIQDIEVANYEFKKFLQKMKRKYTDFKHVSVIEFQDRGAIHYHMMTNILHSFTEKDCEGEGKGKSPQLQTFEKELGRVWGNGFVFVKPVNHVDNTGAYLTKYMQKDIIDERLNGKKRYFYSRNLTKPLELDGAELVILKDSLEGNIPVYTSEYYGEFSGKVKYTEFNLKRLEIGLFDYGDK